ncbi:MAG TPA: GWxTD domain-containing protein [Candidatus Kapabacteria bacterium]|nr:GWxTD domain-containing protein [Candidatus Kapabacteria bacterium]HOV92276.1 GWxTD domain-containing protein [Candidatus Kapabacteria bacterium]
MKKLYTFLIAVLFSTVPLFSSNININYDFALFKYSKDTLLLEIYYTFIDSNLTYQRVDSQQVGILDISILFENLNNGQKKELSWKHTNIKPLSDTFNIYNLYGVKKILLKPAEYSILTTAYDDKNLDNHSNDKASVVIKNFSEKSITLSSIELAQVIEDASKVNQNSGHFFIKGNYYVLPNVIGEYNSDEPNLHLYFEIYNAKTISPNSVKITFSILDGAQREVNKSSINIIPKSDAISEIFSIPLDLLSTGIYYLKVSLLDTKDDNIIYDNHVKKFYYFNKNSKLVNYSGFTEDQLFEMSEFAALSYDQTELEFKKSKAIATNFEVDQWKKLTDLKARQRFLYRFWKIRDSDTSTFYNEDRGEYLERIKYAETYFTFTEKNPGWNTDRGRIYLKYGEPTQRDRYSAGAENRPYEDWFYGEIQGGVHFIFVDMVGYGNYILVHSDLKGEPNDPDWYNNYVKERNFLESNGLENNQLR